MSSQRGRKISKRLYTEHSSANLYDLVFGNGEESDQGQLREVTKKDVQAQMAADLDDLLKTEDEEKMEVTQKEFESFKRLYSRFLDNTGRRVIWEKIERLPPDSVRDYADLSQPDQKDIKQMLDKLVVVKLNGLLGTNMGFNGPKSLIPVRNDLTFLDLAVHQIEHLNKTYGANVPLVLMNSFYTDEETQKVLRRYMGFKVTIYSFIQSRFPCIHKESLMPISKSCQTEEFPEAWYPPGHGDFYEAFYHSELLQEFIKQGREYVFMSNIDNLGATVDLNILNLLLNPPDQKQHEFLMEGTDKTRADVKGGTLVKYEDKIRLLEIGQVPKEHVDDFKSVKSFKCFNTNNLWIKMDAIKRLVEKNQLDMEVIVNERALENGQTVLQLETAVGAAMKNFENGMGIRVPRSRFLPVKRTSDLLLAKSNLYDFHDGFLTMSPKRMFQVVPLIKFGDQFTKVNDFIKRFGAIPDLLELDHLTVSGDVTFGRKVSLKGTVIIVANHGERIDVPTGAILENKTVSGNLRILDH